MCHEREIPNGCQHHPQADTSTTPSNTGRFCLKNTDFSSSLITSGVCGNRDRLEVTCWSGRGFEKGSSTQSLLTSPWRKGPSPCSAGLTWSCSASFTGFGFAHIFRAALQAAAKLFKDIMRKGWKKTPEEVHVDLTEGEGARFAAGNWAV